MTIFSHIVIGAGITGTSAAYELSKDKRNKVLCIEQYPLLHWNGSSHGQSRIIRWAYDDVVYSHMGKLSIDLWREIEKDSKGKVYFQSGGIDFGKKDSPELDEVLQVVKKNNLSVDYIKGGDLSKRWSAFSDSVSDDILAVYEQNAGILNAQEAVRLLQWLAMKNGALFHQQERFIKHEKDGVITVYTDGGKYRTKKLIFCCGAWTKSVLHKSVSLDLEVVQMTYFFWKVKEENREATKKLPIWIYRGKYETQVREIVTPTLMEYYGFPTFEIETGGDRMKAAAHFSLPSDEIQDISERKFTPNPEKYVLTLEFMNEVFGCIEEEPFEKMIEEGNVHTCLYTNSKNCDFIIDALPGNSDVYVFAGGSGHAFKFAPVIGMMIRDLCDHPHRKNFFNDARIPRNKFSIKPHVLQTSKL